MKRDKVISIRLNEVEYAHLARLAELRGVKVSDVVRSIINEPPSFQLKQPYGSGTLTTTAGEVKYFIRNGGLYSA